MRVSVFAALLAGAMALDGKSIVDPVLKHDAKQCGQYLCPGFPNAAEVCETSRLRPLGLSRKPRPLSCACAS